MDAYTLLYLTWRTHKDLLSLNSAQSSVITLWSPGGRIGEGIVREFGMDMDMDTLLYLIWRTNKNLLSSTGNSAQCHVAAWMGGEFAGEGILVYGRLSPPAARSRSSAPAKVMRKEAGHTQRWDRTSGVPLEILEHLPQNQSLPTFCLCFHLNL